MRVKRGVTSHAKHKKILRANKGYRMTKRRLIKVATESFLHAGEYAFQGRRQKKRDFRRLWITRIGEAAKAQEISYSVLIKKLSDAKIALDRKVLARLVVAHPEVFKALIEKVK